MEDFIALDDVPDVIFRGTKRPSHDGGFGDYEESSDMQITGVTRVVPEMFRPRKQAKAKPQRFSMFNKQPKVADRPLEPKPKGLGYLYNEAKAVDQAAVTEPWQETLAYLTESRLPSTDSDVIMPYISARNRGPDLSALQEKALELALSGRSLFFTGSAGTGKSFLLRHMIQRLRAQYPNNNRAVAVTSTTGLAALNIGGSTINRWAGIGLGIEPVPVLAKKVKNSRNARANWKSARVLVVDEVSMMSGALFEKLDQIGRILRDRNDLPFGGLQLVLTGDFFQLPPVEKGRSSNQPRDYCFKAPGWARAVPHAIELTHVFRQEDLSLVSVLNAMRVGNLTDKMVEVLRNLSREVNYEDGLGLTELYPLKVQVAESNDKQLQGLRGLQRLYSARDHPSSPAVTASLDNTFLAERELYLKVNAPVLHIRNDPESSLVNGSRGKVVAFSTPLVYLKLQEHCLPPAHERSDSELCRVKVNGKMVPLLDIYNEGADLIEAGNLSFEAVPTVTVKTSDMRFKSRLMSIQRQDRPIYDTLVSILMLLYEEHAQRQPMHPVCFFNKVGYVHIHESDFTVGETGNESKDSKEPSAANKEPQMSRTQLPLILAWSMSIHKAQGQTIDRLKVDLGRSFEAGQVYVAISRAVSQECLQIVNFQPSKVMIDADVTNFYRNLVTE